MESCLIFNLIACLKEIITAVEYVQSTVTNFLEIQTRVNQYLLKHKHQDSAGKLTSDMIENRIPKEIVQLQKTVISDIIKNEAKFSVMTKAFFNPVSDKYINSSYNRVN